MCLLRHEPLAGTKTSLLHGYLTLVVWLVFATGIFMETIFSIESLVDMS